MFIFRNILPLVVFAALLESVAGGAVAETPARLTLATFSADVTIPLGHRCMGVLPTKSKKIVDPLFAYGMVLSGAGKPIVLVAVDWCEIRNGAYDQWRDALAKAAGTRRERVLVTSLHQHDAPVVDKEAQQLLTSVGLAGELYDLKFHDKTLARVAEALRKSLSRAQPVTHIGTGQAKVNRVASNRRVVTADGRIHFHRGSSSGGNRDSAAAPEGRIDPWLKTITFYNGDKPLLCLHAYATHPMSYYGRGGVSADFVGMARSWMRRDAPGVAHIYLSGCSGDVTAGKYNDGSAANRPVLAERIYKAMQAAMKSTRRQPLKQIAFRNTKLTLPFNDNAAFSEEALNETLQNPKAKVTERILAAMGLSSRRRIARGQAIDMPCIDLGPAQIVLQPGEAFVGYQLMAQQIRPQSFVMSIGYGECWPGYIPTKQAFDERFGSSWRWVAPGCELRMEAALRRVLVAGQDEH